MDLQQPFSFWGAGDILVDVLSDTGIETGLQLKGDCPEVTIQTAGETEENLGSGRENTGQVIGSVSIPKPGKSSFTLAQADPEMFAMGFYGTAAAMSQSSGSGTTVTLDVIPGRWVKMGKYRTSNEVVKDITDTTTFVLGTDYEVNQRLGMIKVIAGSSLAAESQMHATFDHAAVTGATIKGMTKTNIRVRLEIDGKDLDSGRDFHLIIYQLRLAPTGDVTIKGKKFLTAKFNGVMETPAGESEPFKLVFLDEEV